MSRITNEVKKKVVKEHIQDGGTLNSLAAEYGVSHATISNWVQSYREECQTNNHEKSQLELDEFGLRWLLNRMNIHPNAYYNYSKQKKDENLST